MTSSIAPFLIFYAGAGLAVLCSGWVRSAVLLAVPLVGGYNLYLLGSDASATIGLFGYTLEFIRIDKLSMVFGILFHLATFLGVIFSLHVKTRMEPTAAMVYAGSALGAVFAGDLILLFVFWEMLAISSVFLILARGSERSYNTSMRYLIIQVLSGVVLLAGVLIRIHETGTITFDYIGLGGLGGTLIFLAIGIKCAFPMLHNWLIDAYPESTPTGTVFLTAFTTKVAVYALARAFPGTEILVNIGLIMALFPIFYAVIENDLRRVLSYSMINQIGFMVVGIGLGTDLGINGAVSHAFNDVIFKGLLMMSMGAVLFRTGKINGSDLGGLYKSMPWTTGFCIVGAASISAFPLFSGFVSKSMIMVSALEEGHIYVWLALMFASAGVMEHAGIKIPYFAFFAHDSGIRCKEAPPNMLIAMGLAAFICIFNGTYPWLLYSLLPMPVNYEPYTWTHVVTQNQLLLFAALAVLVLILVKRYPPELPSVNIDSDWLYRRLAPKALRWLGRSIQKFDAGIRKGGLGFTAGVMRWVERHHGLDGMLARTHPAGVMVSWMIGLLILYLLLYFAG